MVAVVSRKPQDCAVYLIDYLIQELTRYRDLPAMGTVDINAIAQCKTLLCMSCVDNIITNFQIYCHLLKMAFVCGATICTVSIFLTLRWLII